jgi:hypothetical protein
LKIYEIFSKFRRVAGAPGHADSCLSVGLREPGALL